jgi:hypothetical protein
MAHAATAREQGSQRSIPGNTYHARSEHPCLSPRGDRRKEKPGSATVAVLTRATRKTATPSSMLAGEASEDAKGAAGINRPLQGAVLLTYNGTCTQISGLGRSWCAPRGRGERGRALKEDIMQGSKGVSADGDPQYLRGPAHPHRCKHTKRPIREKREKRSRLRTTCQLGPVYRGSPARSQSAARARRNPAMNAPVSQGRSILPLSAGSSRLLFFVVLGKGSQRGSQSRGGVPKEGPVNPAAARRALDQGHIWPSSDVSPRGRRADAVVELKPVA